MPSPYVGPRQAYSNRSRRPAATPNATRSRPLITPSSHLPLPVRPAVSTTRLRACPWCPLRLAPPQARLLRSRACYMCKNHYTVGRRVLPPTLPGVRRAQPRQARRSHRPHRQERPTHRRPRQDRHVYRAATASRRRPHDDHHPLSERCRAPLRRDARQRRLAAPATHRRDRPSRPRSGRRARGLRGRAGPTGHSDQQRRPDGAPSPRLLRCARRGGAHPRRRNLST